jgi:hypothetical protein
MENKIYMMSQFPELTVFLRHHLECPITNVGVSGSPRAEILWFLNHCY